ncbi:MAG: 2-oxoacid:acceptor oxidoreductase subunit alpha [Candidatus Heimdallarchaeota archaeon]|nr:MAG: 2-oxoacid:acceptor oxidoreductase subunit alpha [Candidatus Heimdallarchaeota archaeon]
MSSDRNGKLILTTGNYASAEGAIAVGCRYFGGYPITPSSEIAHYMSRRLPQVGGTFIQMEDELASIVSVVGASYAGVKAMTATSGPGLSLMAETVGLGFMLEAPMVIITVMRGGPSTGQPTKASQSDVMQTRYLSHGDYEMIVLAPSTVQECYDFSIYGFNLAEKYRTPVIIATDGIVGQMMEPVRYHSNFEIINRKPPQVSPDEYQPFQVLDEDLIPGMATAGSEYNFYVTGLTHDDTGSPDMTPERAVKLITRLCDKIRRARTEIHEYVPWEEQHLDDAEVVILSYGINSRGVPEAVERAREKGHKVGLIRLRTLWPFPEELMEKLGRLGVKKIIVNEMNYGQIIREVERFRHLGFKVTGSLVPTTIPFSPRFIYEELLKEV